MLTSRLSRGRPPTHTGPPHNPCEGQASSAQEPGTMAHACFYLETCLARVELFVLFSTKKKKKKKKKKGNALRPQDVFLHAGILMQTMGRKKMTTRKDRSAFAVPSRLLFWFCFKNTLWAAAKSPAVSGAESFCRALTASACRTHARTHARTHTHSNTPLVCPASWVSESIGNNQTCSPRGVVW